MRRITHMRSWIDRQGWDHLVFNTPATHDQREEKGMKRTSKGAILALIATGGTLLLVALWLCLSGGAQSQAHALAQDASPLVLNPANNDPFPPLVVQSTPVACTLEITTTDKAPFDNHTSAQAATIANYTGQALVEGNLPDPSIPITVSTKPDFYRLDNAIPQTKYTVQAKPDWTTNYNLGIIVYDRNKVPIITDTNTADYSAIVVLIAEDPGPYFFEVFQISAQCSGHTYSLIYGTTAPTVTPTPTPTSTPLPNAPTPQPTWQLGFDAYEPNYDFTKATTIAPGITYNLNFVPWGGAIVDNDFFKIRVKPGLQLSCETSELDPGVDPRMVMYRGPGEEYFISANDDIQLGNFNSRLSYYATFEGYVYLLVGQGNRMAAPDTTSSDYKLNCKLGVGISVTPPPDKGPGPTPSNPTATPQPTPTPRPNQSPLATPTPPAPNRTLSFRLITRPDPPTPSPEPSGFRTFRVQIYFDGNYDGQLGAGEGVTGFYVIVLSSDSSEEMAQGYTDEQGQLSFTVPTISTVRVLIPLLGFDRLVEASKPDVTVRIIPPMLPNTMP